MGEGERRGADLRTEKAFLSDDEIVTLFFRRSETAIGEAKRKYGNYLRKVARNILGDGGEIEESENDTYLAAWERIPPEKPQSLLAFLSVIIRRISINRYKSNTRKKRVPTELTTSLSELEECLADTEAERLADAKALGDAINAFLRTLDERRRYVFVKRYYFATSAKEIAKTLGITEFGVYKLLSRMKDEMKAFLIEKEVFL